MSKHWSIQKLWNELVTEERVIEPKDYIRGSDIGKPLLERYLKMRGIQYTNPFESRILRVFDCGNIFEQEVMVRMFELLGLLVTTQDEVVNELPGMLRVVGHHDPMVGGKIDVESAMEKINSPNISDWMRLRATALLKKMVETYPDGLNEIITEIKTVNSRAFWAHKNVDPETGFFKGYHHHKLQLFNYLKARNHPEGRLFYISKDDLTLMETSVFLTDKNLEEEWLADIKSMTDMWNRGKEMDKSGQGELVYDSGLQRYVIAPWLQEYMPESIVFNEDKGEWELNWEVGRSNYLTLLTGYANTDEWESATWSELKKKNMSPCKGCEKEFTLKTLNKKDGYCAKCAKEKIKKETR